MATVKLCVPRRLAAQEELPVFLGGQAAELTVLPEGFLRSKEDMALALRLTEGWPGTVLAGYRDGDEEKAVVLESGNLVDTYTKCILTSSERAHGKRPGDKIHCLQSALGRLAVPVCYEVHFPEVCRAMALEGPALMVNIIGTGMYHELQYGQWRALARARAIENELPVMGCCHFCGEIPLAFAFDSGGREILAVKGQYGSFQVEVDLEQSGDRPIGYFADRRPALFGGLVADLPE